MDDELDLLSSLNPVPDVSGNPGPVPGDAIAAESDRPANSAYDHAIELASVEAEAPARRRLSVLALAAVVIALLGVGAVAVLSADDEADRQELSLEEDDEEPEEEAEESDDDDVDISRPPAAAAVAATPTDGQDSLRHPLLTEPREGLTDGQRVSVSGAEFPPNEQVGVVQCVFTGENGSVDDCDIGQVELVLVSPDGTFEAEFSVRRNFPTTDGAVDCASPPEDQVCMIAAGALSNYDESGVASIFFASDGEAAEAPVLQVDETEGLVHDQPLVVTGSGFGPGEEVNLHQCSIGGFSGIQQCSAGNVGYLAVADNDGNIAVTVPAQRSVVRHDGITDCATDEFGCFLISQRVPAPNITRLSFDPDGPPGPQPQMTIEPAVDLVEGQVVQVTVSELPFDGPADINQCVAVDLVTRCNPASTSVNVVDGSLAAEVTVTRGITLSGLNPVDCAEADCNLRVSVAGAQLVEGQISFDPEGPEPELPELIVEPSTGLAHLDSVEIRITGREGNFNFAQLCADPQNSELSTETHVPTSCVSLGALENGPLRISRMMWNGHGDDIDCATTQCFVISYTDVSGQLRTPISFDPSLPAPPTPILTLAPDGPYADGDSVTVSLEGVPTLDRSLGEISGDLCSTNRSHCRFLSFSGADGTQIDTAQMSRMLPSTSSDEQWLDCAVDECVVSIHTPLGEFYVPVTFDASQPCLLYTSPSPRDATLSRMPSSA